jgi:hypothetical protein
MVNLWIDLIDADGETLLDQVACFQPADASDAYKIHFGMEPDVIRGLSFEVESNIAVREASGGSTGVLPQGRQSCRRLIVQFPAKQPATLGRTKLDGPRRRTARAARCAGHPSGIKRTALSGAVSGC